jgi:hypothetical protein
VAEDEGSIFLQNVGTDLQVHMVAKPRGQSCSSKQIHKNVSMVTEPKDSTSITQPAI